MLRDRAVELLAKADYIRPRVIGSNGKPNFVRILEEFLYNEIPDFELEVVNELRDENRQRIEAQIVNDPTPTLQFDEMAYVLGEGSNESSAVFSALHEAIHLFEHNLKTGLTSVVPLRRGLPGSGTSFKETPDQETEANFGAAAVFIDHRIIGPHTTPAYLSLESGASNSTARAFLRTIRAVYPDKWRLR